MSGHRRTRRSTTGGRSAARWPRCTTCTTRSSDSRSMGTSVPCGRTTGRCRRTGGTTSTCSAVCCRTCAWRSTPQTFPSSTRPASNGSRRDSMPLLDRNLCRRCCTATRSRTTSSAPTRARSPSTPRRASATRSSTWRCSTSSPKFPTRGVRRVLRRACDRSRLRRAARAVADVRLPRRHRGRRHQPVRPSVRAPLGRRGGAVRVATTCCGRRVTRPCCRRSARERCRRARCRTRTRLRATSAGSTARCNRCQTPRRRATSGRRRARRPRALALPVGHRGVDHRTASTSKSHSGPPSSYTPYTYSSSAGGPRAHTASDRAPSLSGGGRARAATSATEMPRRAPSWSMSRSLHFACSASRWKASHPREYEPLRRIVARFGYACHLHLRIVEVVSTGLRAVPPGHDKGWRGTCRDMSTCFERRLERHGPVKPRASRLQTARCEVLVPPSRRHRSTSPGNPTSLESESSHDPQPPSPGPADPGPRAHGRRVWRRRRRFPRRPTRPPRCPSWRPPSRTHPPPRTPPSTPRTPSQPPPSRPRRNPPPLNPHHRPGGRTRPAVGDNPRV